MREELLALKTAKELEINAFGFLGAHVGKALHECEIAFLAPSNHTGRIQK